MKHCTRCLFTSAIAYIHPDGECEYCKLHDHLSATHHPNEWQPILNRIKSKRKQYDCLIGISGGFDSATLLFKAVKEWGLKPLVIHFDNHYNVPAAEHNIKTLVQLLDVDFIRYYVNFSEYNKANRGFLMAALPDADIPNDMVMTSLMYSTAKRYKIKYILNGHDYRTEGSTPKGWTYMDARYIKSVMKALALRTDTTLPLFTFTEQLKYALSGIKNIRPFYYTEPDMDKEKLRLINDYGLQDYGGKHQENAYTDFVGTYYLPKYHNIDKRLVYLSARVRSGLMGKAEAMQLMNKPGKLSKYGSIIMNRNKRLIAQVEPRQREDFARYNFKRWRWAIWVMVKFGALPYTFYRKYCF